MKLCLSVICSEIFVLLYSNPIAGESALDRLACGLGGKTMLPHITTNIPQMLQNSALICMVSTLLIVC